MKPSEVYREAARRMAENENASEFSCIMIERAQGDSYRESDIDEYNSFFKPENEDAYAWGWRFATDNIFDYRDPYVQATANDCRILALCFMAAIAEDDE